MPIYEYRCRKCGNVFEEWVKTFDSPELEPCPKCGGDAERIMSNTSFKLEGGGGSRPATAGKRPVLPVMPPRRGRGPAKAEAAASGSGGGSKAGYGLISWRRGRLPAPFSYSFCEEIP